MDRRDFFQLLSAAGLSLTCPLASRSAFAADPEHLLVTVMASGGWDATMLCDPKGNTLQEGKGYINPFAANEIKSAANDSPIKYAPILEGYEDIGSFDTFFSSYYQKMLVINGITMSGSHASGLQDAAAGSAAFPTIGAMHVASHGNNLSNGFISFGGAGGGDDPFGAAAITRIGDISSMSLLAQSNSYQHETVFDLIEQAKRAAADRLSAQEQLPARRRAIGQLINASNSPASVSNLVSYIPGEIASGMVGQAELISAAFASGMSIAGNLKISPFDSHTKNDQYQSPNLQEVVAAVNKLWEMAEQYGYDDKLVVLMLSEGGRGPFYNTESGKDDINLSSMIIMSNAIAGNRVIQATDDSYEALAIQANTHSADANGEIIRPAHVHRELRQLLNINASLVEKYSISANDMGLLGI